MWTCTKFPILSTCLLTRGSAIMDTRAAPMIDEYRSPEMMPLTYASLLMMKANSPMASRAMEQ